MKNFQKIVIQLNKLRGKKSTRVKKAKFDKPVKFLNNSKINLSTDKKKLTYNFVSDDSVQYILDKHKNFLKIHQNPLSPIASSPESIKFDCKEKISINFQLDDSVRNILDEHKNFLEKYPKALSPLPESLKKVKPRILSIVTIPEEKRITFVRNTFKPLGSSQNMKKNSDFKEIKSCIIHSTNKPLQFCIDCFLSNYLGPEFEQDSGLAQSAKNFKNTFFPSFDNDDSNFDFFIDGTELPLFDTLIEIKYLEQVFSCKKHIFSPPREKPCDSCFWINWLKH